MAKNYSQDEFTRVANRMRTWLMNLARKRSSGVVTADDAHTYLDRQGVQAQPRTRLRYINTVLREPTFAYEGQTRSTRPRAKGRMITEWTV